MRFILILLCVVLLPTQAHACKDMRKAILDYQTIFKGKVLSTRELSTEEQEGIYHNKSARVEVSRQYKRTVNDITEIYYFSTEGFTREQLLERERMVRAWPFEKKFEVDEVVYFFTNDELSDQNFIKESCVREAKYIDPFEVLELEHFKVKAAMYAETLNNISFNDQNAVQYVELLKEQAIFHEFFNDFPTALAAYKMAIKAVSKYNLLSSDQVAVEWNFYRIKYTQSLELGIGRIHFKQGKYQDAKNVFGKIIAELEKFEKLDDEAQYTLDAARELLMASDLELEEQNP